MGSESYTLGHNSLDILVPALFLAESDTVGKEILLDLRIMKRRTKLLVLTARSNSGVVEISPRSPRSPNSII